MKIRAMKELMAACSDGVVRDCKPGDVISVFHATGRRLLYRRMALWVGSEPFDVLWDPPASMKEARPQRDKMLRGMMNKGVA